MLSFVPEYSHKLTYLVEQDLPIITGRKAALPMHCVHNEGSKSQDPVADRSSRSIPETPLNQPRTQCLQWIQGGH